MIARRSCNNKEYCPFHEISVIVGYVVRTKRFLYRHSLCRGEQKYLFALLGDGIGIFFGQFSENFEILKTKNIQKISGF